LQGATQPQLIEQHAILAQDVKGAEGRESYLPASLRTDTQGRLIVEALKWGGSSDFVAFTRARVLLIVAAGDQKQLAGSVVRVVNLPE
jgi:molybdopterin biosynthesis enzyme